LHLTPIYIFLGPDLIYLENVSLKNPKSRVPSKSLTGLIENTKGNLTETIMITEIMTIISNEKSSLELVRKYVGVFVVHVYF
jgi:hypothetical protein